MAENIRTPTPFRRRNDRRSILRTLPLSPIGDIAGATLSESTDTTETITWSTANDWDNAVGKRYITNDVYGDLTDDSQIQIGLDADPDPDFDATVGAHFACHEDNLNDYSGNGNGGTFQNKPNTEQTGVFAADSHEYVNSSNDYSTHPIDHSNVKGFGVWIYNNDISGTKVIHGVADNWYGFRDGQPASYNGQSTNEASINVSTGVWVPYFVRYDNGGNITFSVEGQEASISLSSLSGGTSQIGRNPYSGGQNYLDSKIANLVIFTSDPTQADADYWNRTDANGFLTTATKSFSSAVEPNLTNLSYVLNGETISIDVIGSPGTADEEVVTQSLDGSSSYSLTWSATHTDFRVEPNMSTSSPPTTPTLSQISLEG